jgi:hypothetical protein
MAYRQPPSEILPRREIEIRQDHAGAWRVYPCDPRFRDAALREQGVVLGGTWDQAVADAVRVAIENGFFFRRPPALWLPSSS